MKQKYLKNDQLMECSLKAQDSPVWKNILRCRFIINKGIRWKIGDGENIKLWWDNWNDNTNLAELLDKDSILLVNP